MSDNYLTGRCPNCDNKLQIKPGEATVTCYCCDTTFAASEITSGGAKAHSAATSMAATSANAELESLALSVNDSEGGLVYLESFFANFDWDYYKKVRGIEIKAIKEMVDKNKIKFSKNPNTYVLEFESIHMPVLKKLEGLADLENNIREEYDAVDATNAYGYYDTYVGIVKTLISKREAVLKTLQNAVTFAAKLGLEQAQVNELHDKLAALTDRLNGLEEPTGLEELPAVKALITEIEQRVEADYLAKGVDAKQVYSEAMHCYEQGDRSAALLLFSRITDYKDSVTYINHINRIFDYNDATNDNFDGNLIVFGDKKYFADYVKPKILSVADPKKGCASIFGKKKAAQPTTEATSQEDVEALLALFEIVDGVPAKEPIVKQITDILCVYGSKLFYIENYKKICSYDFNSKLVAVLDETKSGDYIEFFDGDLYKKSADGTKLIFKKKLKVNLVADMKKGGGCLSIFKKKQEEVVRVNNNYSVITIDLKTEAVTPVLPEVIDVVDFFGDELFYTKAEEIVKEEGKKHPITEVVENFYAYNLTSKADEKILDEDCIIHTVYKGKIVFSRQTPIMPNLTLYVHDIETKEEIMLEANIYRYFGVINGKVYYTVGNALSRPLFSINFDGSERTEIMANVEKVAAIKAGWMYIVKGSGRNCVLVKVSVDGKKRIILCTQFNYLVKFTNEYVHYIDVSNNLRVVRNDGRDDRLIANSIDGRNVIIAEDKIYFLRNEYMGMYRVNGSKKNIYAKSIYTMDVEGRNLRKILYGVDSMSNFDDNNIVVRRVEHNKYIFSTPVDKSHYEKSVHEYDVTRYFMLNKETYELTNFLSIGEPEAETLKIKSGCIFKKPISKDVIIEQVAVPVKYERAGVASVGQVQEEAEEEAAAKEAAAAIAQGKAPINNGCSALDGCKKGCAGLLKKK